MYHFVGIHKSHQISPRAPFKSKRSEDLLTLTFTFKDNLESLISLNTNIYSKTGALGENPPAHRDTEC